MRFNDLLVAKDGMIKGPFGGDIKKSLFVTKGPNTYKVLEQSVVLNKDITLGNYYLDSEYVEKKLKRFIVKDGDILITGAGTLGQIFEVNNLIEPAVINQALIRIRLNANIVNKKYFKYYFKYSVLRMIEGINGDSVIPNLPPLSIIKDTKINIPDLPTQQKIAAVLSALDDKIELNNKINAELEAMAKTLYDYWFVQFEFPNAEGKPYKSSGGKMVYNPILKREIPEGWEVKRFGEFVDSVNTGLNPRDHFKLGYGDNYYITIKNIEYGVIKFDNSCDRIDDISLARIQKRSNLEKGDILFTSIEPVGKTYLLHEKPKNWNINESVFSLKPNYSLLTSEYLFMLASSEEMKFKCKYASTGSIHKGIRINPLKEFVFHYPKYELIKLFTDIIYPILVKIDINQKQNQELAALRDWLLPMLMNGQVKVEDTYGSTEPQANLAAEAATEHQN